MPKKSKIETPEFRDELKQFFRGMTNAFVLFESVFNDRGLFCSYRFVYINEAYERITGVKCAEVKGKTVHEVWPKTEPEWIKRYGEVAVTGVPQTFDMYHEPTSKHYHCNVYRPMDTQDRFCVIFEDITERKCMEDNLRESEERFRVIFERSTIGKSLTGLDGKLHRVNAAFAEMLGLTIDELQQSHFASITHPEDVAESQECIRCLLGNEKTIYRMEKRYRHSDHHYIWADVSSTLFRNLQGIPVFLITSIVDISERKLAEQEIRLLNETLENRIIERTAQLNASNKELEAFAYSVSHDLRAPLRGIDGWSHALFEDYGGQLDEQARTYINRVRSEAQRMGKLIDDLLQLSRLTRVEMRREKVNLSVIAQTIVARLADTFPGRFIEFVVHPDLTAQGDAQLLEIALFNLLGNAFKFTEKCPHAHIEFGKTESQDGCAFFVRDNGAGFDMAYAKKLFGAFQRLHKVSEFPGTGIGLATVQRIVHRHGGQVWAEAKVDQGATFHFTLEGNK